VILSQYSEFILTYGSGDIIISIIWHTIHADLQADYHERHVRAGALLRAKIGGMGE
jgi:hypothetical protein